MSKTAGEHGPPGGGDASNRGLDPALESLRPHPIRDLFHLQPGRPAVVVGVRMALVVAAPMAVGAAIGELVPATAVCLGALNAGMADVGGARSSRWHGLIAAAVLDAVAFAVGTLAGRSIWIAVPLMFAVAFGCGLANLFGNVSANVGFVVSILYIVGVGTPGDGSLALERLWLTLAGGAWAITVVLVLWPVRPFAMAASAIGDCCRSLSAMIRSMSCAWEEGSTTGPSELDDAARAVRAKMEAARSVLTDTRAARRGDSVTGRRLHALLRHIGRLFDESEGWEATRSTTLPRLDWTDAGTVVARVLVGIAETLDELGGSIRRMDASPELDPVHRLNVEVEGLHAQLADARANADLASAVGIRTAVASLSEMTSTLGAMTVALTVPGWAVGAGSEIEDPGMVLTVVAPPWRARVARVVRTIRSNLTVDSMVTRHALRFGTAAALGLAIVMGTHLTKGYWVTLTIAVVLRPFAAATLSRTLLRVFGTMLGALLTAALVVGITNKTQLVVAMFILSVLAFSLMPLNYALGVVFLTPLVIVLIEVSSPGGWELAVRRMFDTLLGGTLALVAGYLLWPDVDRAELIDDLAASLTADRLLLKATFGAIAEQADVRRSDEIEALHLRAGLAIDNVVARFQQLLAEAPSRRGPVDVLWSLTEGSRGLFVGTIAIAEHLRSIDDPLDDPRLVTIQTLLDQQLGRMISALIERRALSDDDQRSGELAATVTSLRDEAIDARRVRRAELEGGRTGDTPAARTVAHRAVIESATIHIVHAVEDLRKEVGVLNRWEAYAGSGGVEGIPDRHRP